MKVSHYSYLELLPVFCCDESAGPEVHHLETVVRADEIIETVTRDGVTLIQSERDEAGEGVGGDDLTPDHVIQTVHQHQRH